MSNLEKNIPRTWDKLSYTDEKRVPKSEEPLAMSWPTIFIKRNKNNIFTDNNGNPLDFSIITPNSNIDFEGEQLDKVIQTLENLTPLQIDIAKYWATGPATKQWTPIIDRLIDTYKISAPRAARILAAVQGAINDAFVIAWHYKYLWKIARPNQLDQTLKTLLCTPNHPSYPSGHATVAGCAETVLSYFFECESTRLRELAEECAISRLYAGVHYEIDNDEGLRLGRYIGTVVVSILKHQYEKGQNKVDYPISQGKFADLMPPPYTQVIPYNYKNNCTSSTISNSITSNKNC